MAKEGPAREKLTIVAKPASVAIQPAPPSPRPPLSESAVRKLSAKEVLAGLRDFAANWTKEAEAALAVPGELNFFRNDEGGSVMFSKETGFPIAGVLSSLQTGMRAPPDTEYGIAVYEKSSTSYLVLVDRGRRIVVRELVSDYNSKPAKKDWDNVVKAIRSAEKAAAANPGRTAVFDGVLSII